MLNNAQTDHATSQIIDLGCPKHPRSSPSSSVEPRSARLKADTFFARVRRVKNRDLSTARQRSILMRIGITSVESHHQVPYCGPMPLVHPPANTSIAHGCVPHVIFHKATCLTHGRANLKLAQQSSNGAQTGPKVPSDDTVTDFRGCGYIGKSPELATCPVLHSQSARNDKTESVLAVAERAAPDPSDLPQTTRDLTANAPICGCRPGSTSSTTEKRL